MSICSVEALVGAPAIPAPVRSPRVEVLVGTALLLIALIGGLATAADYGLTLDEFNTDDYGPKALAWYTSLGFDRSHFETVEPFLWYYGPWHQILIALVQSLDLADPIAVRHALTFLAGLVGLAALIPIARLSIGGWAGPIAILLCLITGYFYGSLFFTPIDVPFLAAMSWATWAVLIMARGEVPAWSTTVAAGLLTGLAMATRTGGIITHAYLIGAMALSAVEALIRKGRHAAPVLSRMAARTLAAIAIAWITAIALWPWLQIGNPLRQFAIAHMYFTHSPLAFEFPHWGEMISTNALPWSYVPGQLLARLPEGFLALLAIAFVLAAITIARLVRASAMDFRNSGLAGLKLPALLIAQERGTLVVVAAAVVPVAFVIMTHATHYDGIRHLLFIIPMLALLAAGALLQFAPRLRRYPAIAVLVLMLGLAQFLWSGLTMLRLHPLEYVAFNALAGGTQHAAGRFELDYWGAAATEAIRMLERRLDNEPTGRFTADPPRVYVCLFGREWTADTLFRRDWDLAEDLEQADFIIETERWPCVLDRTAVVVDEVKRLGVSFARIYAINRGREFAPAP
jgi:hypothetical protein